MSDDRFQPRKMRILETFTIAGRVVEKDTICDASSVLAIRLISQGKAEPIDWVVDPVIQAQAITGHKPNGCGCGK